MFHTPISHINTIQSQENHQATLNRKSGSQTSNSSRKAFTSRNCNNLDSTSKKSFNQFPKHQSPKKKILKSNHDIFFDECSGIHEVEDTFCDILHPSERLSTKDIHRWIGFHETPRTPSPIRNPILEYKWVMLELPPEEPLVFDLSVDEPLLPTMDDLF